MLKVQNVEVKFIPQIWHIVEPFIASGLKYTDDWTIDQIKVYLSSGAWILLVAVDDLQQIHGVCTIAFENGANDRTAIITTLGGKFVVLQEIFDQVCTTVRRLGATRIQAYTRDTAIRLYEKVGLKKKATLMEVRL
jgi:hypothetical protein